MRVTIPRFFRFLARAWVPALLAGLLAPLGAGAQSCRLLLGDGNDTRRIGVETIHRDDRGNVISIFLPLPKANHGQIRDLQTLGFNSAYPKDFTISDGTLKTAFISVDLHAGSPLQGKIERLAHEVSAEARGGDPLPLLAGFVSRHLADVPQGWRLPWDPLATHGIPAEFYAVKDFAPGHGPLTVADRRHPTVPLEAFLAEGKGACLPKVLLTSLIMKKLGLPHRVRAGGTEHTGHMWIELPDGRHLDPTWKLLSTPSTAGALPGWFRFDQTFLFRDQFFPFAEN